MRSSFSRRLAVLSLLFLSLCALAQTPPPKKMTQEQKELVAEVQKWGKETAALRKAGKLEEAIKAAEKMLAAELKLFGELHDDPIGSLKQIADMHEELEQFDEAKKTRDRILESQTKR